MRPQLGWQLAKEFDEMSERPTGMDELQGMGWALKMNSPQRSSASGNGAEDCSPGTADHRHLRLQE